MVPEQSRDGLIFGLASERKAFSLEALDIQLARKRLAGDIVPTIATPTREAGDTLNREHVFEGATGLLAALVTEKQRPGVLAQVALELGHAQRIDVDVDVDVDVRHHVALQRAALHLAIEQVNHHDQKQPDLINNNIRDAVDPDFVGFVHRGLAVQQVWKNRQRVIAVGGDLETPLATETDTVRLHELLHLLLFQPDTTRHRRELTC